MKKKNKWVLVIMESPTKTKIVQEYLNNQSVLEKRYTVLSSNGHIVDLVKSGPFRLGVDLNTFEARYRVMSKKKEIFTTLKEWSKKCSQVILATDLDREGESIAYHLTQALHLEKRATRVRFNEISKEKIIEAFLHQDQINHNLVNAQETRRILDRMIGFRLSKLLREKIRSQSAGRVQSVCLKLIVDRAADRKNFQPVEYWSIEGEYQKCQFKLIKKNNTAVKIHDKQTVLQIAQELQTVFKVVDQQQKTKNEKPYVPYRTATLMQDAANLLGFSTAKTSLLAQQLYEGIKLDKTTKGLITYPRTDATRLSDGFCKKAQKFIETKHGSDYLGTYHNAKQSIRVQNAHEAIRVTDIYLTPAKAAPFLNAGQHKLYRLIYHRSIGALMAPAVFRQVTTIITNGSYSFHSTYSLLEFDGYLKYRNNLKRKWHKKNNLTIGTTFTPNKLIATQHFTQPLPWFTEGSLVKKLEQLEIGRPSTYGHMIKILQKRGYIHIENKALIPFERGEQVSYFLQKLFSNIINEAYTSEIEKVLDQIAIGTADRTAILHRFWDEFEPRVEEAFANITPEGPKKSDVLCPECNHYLVWRYGRYGKFLGCGQFPKCRYVEVKSLGDCPECKTGKLVKKNTSLKTTLIGCTNFQKEDIKCRYVTKKKPVPTKNKTDNKNKIIDLLSIIKKQ